MVNCIIRQVSGIYPSPWDICIEDLILREDFYRNMDINGYKYGYLITLWIFMDNSIGI